MLAGAVVGDAADGLHGISSPFFGQILSKLLLLVKIESDTVKLLETLLKSNAKTQSHSTGQP